MTGNIIQLPLNPHREVQELLPWYVTGQLCEADRFRVEGHLKACDDCRADLVRERLLEQELAREPATVEQGWASMTNRLSLQRRPDRAPAPDRLQIGEQSAAGSPANRVMWRWFGWGIGAQLAVAAVLAVAILPSAERTSFRTLSAAAPPTSGNLVVIFRPDTSEQVLRTTLRANSARLVDGPTSANAYIVAVPAERRDAVAAALRRQPQIVLAAAIDGDPQP